MRQSIHIAASNVPTEHWFNGNRENRVLREKSASECLCTPHELQVAAERTPRFGRGVTRGGVGVEQWGLRP
jgi:hypothetical protein